MRTQFAGKVTKFGAQIKMKKLASVSVPTPVAVITIEAPLASVESEALVELLNQDAVIQIRAAQASFGDVDADGVMAEPVGAR